MEQHVNNPQQWEIVSSRIIDTTREKVFRAWTDPQLLQRWWGPAGFTNTFKEYDLRPGGRWKFTMHGPDKGNYENECVFEKIEKPHLLVWNRLSKPLFRVHVTFDEPEKGKTLLTFRMQFHNQKEYETISKYAPSKNEENFDKLEEVLKSVSGD